MRLNYASLNAQCNGAVLELELKDILLHSFSNNSIGETLPNLTLSLNRESNYSLILCYGGLLAVASELTRFFRHVEIKSQSNHDQLQPSMRLSRHSRFRYSILLYTIRLTSCGRLLATRPTTLDDCVSLVVRVGLF